MPKRTALYLEHQKLGGRLIDFGGWELPVQYSGVMDEHLACRSSAGLFDVSHMGEFHVEGPGAEAFLNYLVTNQVSKLNNGGAQYTVMCHATGGAVDDLIIYRRSPERFLVVVNASNTDKDFAHAQRIEREYKAKHPESRFTLTNESSRYTQIAVQGPKAAKILQELTATPLSQIKTYEFAEGKVVGVDAILARTGYTGEDGFEIYLPWDAGPALWQELLKHGQSEGLKPCGLGARDTLRMEMKYPLYGQELSDDGNPLEAGLGWVVKFDKGDFVGREALLAVKQKGPSRKLVGLKILDRGIPRTGYPVVPRAGGSPIGSVTSGTQSPSLKQAIAIAYVDIAHSKEGTELAVDIRGTPVPAQVTPTPFYKRPT